MKKYYNLLNVFKKKKLNKLSLHRSYDHKTEVKQSIELSICFLYFMLLYKLQKIKKYIKENLSKRFICFSFVFYVLSILFVQKKDEELQFCVNYKKLNNLSKKNFYFILLIQEIITQLTDKKYFSRFNIITIFNNLRMHFNNKEYIIFKIIFKLYMYKKLSFKLIEDSEISQYYINNVLFEFSRKFYFVYLKNVLMFSNIKKKHQAYVQSVLKKLRTAEL